MSASCGHDGLETIKYRNVLWTVFAINAGMFAIEIVAGALASSVSLQADALDFFADAANYLVALFVLERSIQWRAGAALAKGAAMGVFGLYVLGFSAYQLFSGEVPSAPVMGAVGALALIANVVSAVLLFRHREGDSNRQSVWLCSRNDAIANVAVIIAAGLVYLTATHWPDLIVGFFMAGLALHSAWQIIRQAVGELRDGVPTPAE
ncbi:MAG: cation diffusion facilitator family transporter [Alphaproteobacteria bacterium]